MSLQTLASNKRVSLSYTKPLELVTATKPLELVTAGENLKITQLKRKQNGNQSSMTLGAYCNFPGCFFVDQPIVSSQSFF